MTWPPVPAPAARRTWDRATQAAIVSLIDDQGVPVGDVLAHYDLSGSVVRNWRIRLEADDEAPPVGEVPAVAEPDDEPVDDDQALDDEAPETDGTIIPIEFDDTEIGILDALAYLHGQTRDDLVATLLTTYLTEQATHPHVVQAIALRTRWANTE